MKNPYLAEGKPVLQFIGNAEGWDACVEELKRKLDSLLLTDGEIASAILSIEDDSYKAVTGAVAQAQIDKIRKFLEEK